MKRSPLKRREWKHSKRRKPRPDLAAARQQVIERSSGLCEMGGPNCRVIGHHAHHVLRRSQGGKDTPENLLFCCHVCHSQCHENPAEAYERGWMVHP